MMDWVLGLIGGLLYPMFSIIFLALDGLQQIFYVFAGIGDVYYGATNQWSAGTPIKSGITGEINDQGLVFYLLNHSLVKNLLISIMLLALFLIVIFTVMAFLKNMYAAKPKGWKDIIGSAIKGLANFIIVPVLCLLGVWVGNILLNAINGATSGTSGGTQMSRKLFISAAYNSNEFRNGDLNAIADEDKVIDLQDFAKGYWSGAVTDALGISEIESGKTNEYYANIVDQIYANSGISIYDYVTVEKWYSLWEINYLTLVVGGIFMLYALGSLAFAMIRRLFIILILFIISPAVCAMYPLDDGKAVGQWVGEVKKQVLSAYGAVAGLNIFFALLPLIDGINVFGQAGTIAGLNDLVQLFVMVTGLMCVKELISMISNFVGGDDAYSKGTGMIKSSIQKVSKTSSKTVGVFARAAGAKKAGGSFFGSLAQQGGGGALKALGVDTKGVKDSYKEGKEKTFEGREAKNKAYKQRETEKEAEKILKKAGLIKHLEKDDYDNKNFGQMIGTFFKNRSKDFGNAGMAIGREARTIAGGSNKLAKLSNEEIQALLDSDPKMDDKVKQALLDRIAAGKNSASGGFMNIAKNARGENEAYSGESIQKKLDAAKEQRQKEENAAKKADAWEDAQKEQSAAESQMERMRDKHKSWFDGGTMTVQKVTAGELEGLRIAANSTEGTDDEKKGRVMAYQNALNRNEFIEQYQAAEQSAKRFKEKAEEAADALQEALVEAAKKFKGEIVGANKQNMTDIISALKEALKTNRFDDKANALNSEKLLEEIKKLKEALLKNEKESK